jgi:hypothetical protein
LGADGSALRPCQRPGGAGLDQGLIEGCHQLGGRAIGDRPQARHHGPASGVQESLDQAGAVVLGEVVAGQRVAAAGPAGGERDEVSRQIMEPCAFAPEFLDHFAEQDEPATASLALLLEAAGPTGLRRAGAILAERLKERTGEEKPADAQAEKPTEG